jgi:hypothetical protein
MEAPGIVRCACENRFIEVDLGHSSEHRALSLNLNPWDILWEAIAYRSISALRSRPANRSFNTAFLSRPVSFTAEKSMAWGSTRAGR